MAGRIIAGPHVRDACARHLRDLEEGPKRGLTWSPETAERNIRFFSATLKLADGDGVRPFDPAPWQCFVVGSLFGWLDSEGFRRFRVAYIETGKGSGKSPLAGGVGLLMLMADGELRAEVYSAAVDKEQAGILFRDAVDMCKRSDAIRGRVTFSGGEGREYNIAYLRTGSFFRPISSESTGRGKSGYRPHCVLLDEIHEHPTNAMVEFMRAGTKNRRQALQFMITNSGFDRQSVCFEYHEYGRKVAAGDLEDDSFFSYICALDKDEDPFKDADDPELGYPRSWCKANPSIGITFGPKYLREQVQQARGMPSKESIVRRLNFCQWVDAANPWIDGDLWRACEVEEDDWSPPVDAPRLCGLDLSQVGDLTANATARVDEEGVVWAELEFWTPKETLEQREHEDRVPYSAWVRDGYLHAVEGRRIKYDFVAQRIGEINPTALAFDSYRIGEFKEAMDRMGVEGWIWDPQKAPDGPGIRMVRHLQGTAGGNVKVDEGGNAMPRAFLWMPASITALRSLIMDGRLRVRKNPVLTWNSASAVTVSDATGNEKWEKRKSTGRIDGIVALSQVAGLISEPQPEPYEPRILSFSVDDE